MEELIPLLNKHQLPQTVALFHILPKQHQMVELNHLLILLQLPQMVELLPMFQELQPTVDTLHTLLTHQ